MCIGASKSWRAVGKAGKRYCDLCCPCQPRLPPRYLCLHPVQRRDGARESGEPTDDLCSYANNMFYSLLSSHAAHRVYTEQPALCFTANCYPAERIHSMTFCFKPGLINTFQWDSYSSDRCSAALEPASSSWHHGTQHIAGCDRAAYNKLPLRSVDIYIVTS